MIFLGVMLVFYIGYLRVRSHAEMSIQTTETVDAGLTRFADLSFMNSAISPSATSTPDTPIPTFTAAKADFVQNKLWQDEFIDNRNDWLLLDEQFIKSYIIDGIFRYAITCPKDFAGSYCGQYSIVRNLLSKDLEFELDATVTNISPRDAEVLISFLFRDKNTNNYYVNFSSLGQYTINSFHNGSFNRLLEQTTISGFSPNTDTIIAMVFLPYILELHHC